MNEYNTTGPPRVNITKKFHENKKIVILIYLVETITVQWLVEEFQHSMWHTGVSISWSINIFRLKLFFPCLARYDLICLPMMLTLSYYHFDQ